jgi:ATP-dependent Clp protease ATP-binding subunit ClpA
MALLAAEALFGGRERLSRLDLGEYRHADAVVRLLGGPGCESDLARVTARIETGGLLLLDEIEKAHETVLPLLLGFDAGGITLQGGRRVDLSRVHVILTSNLGSAEAARMEAAPESSVERHILKAAERALRPEVFARFTERIVLRRLGPAEQLRITAGLVMRELEFQAGQLRIHPTSEAITRLAAQGWTRELGARPLRSTVEREIGRVLLNWKPEPAAPCDLLETLVLDVAGDGLVLERTSRLRLPPRKAAA